LLFFIEADNLAAGAASCRLMSSLAWVALFFTR
jgi:hypothetical protein